MKSDGSRVKIFVYLLQEGTNVWRPNGGSANRDDSGEYIVAVKQ